MPTDGAVDYWCNLFFPEQATVWAGALAATGTNVQVRTDPEDSYCDAGAMVARMDELGVAALILPTTHRPPHLEPTDFELVAATPDDLDDLWVAHPGRFWGQWSVDPRTGTAGVRTAAAMLERPWCVALHTHTHSFDRRFDHADYYPYYAVCAEQDVPFVMQAGSSGGLMASECGAPVGVDRPALYFPEVRFVLSHTGWPWVAEAIAMAIKFPNVYLGTSVYPPRHWSPELVSFINRAGRTKCLWGTGFPTVGHRHALGQLTDVGLGDEARANLLGGTARRVFSRLR
ncbi:amidohydrolase family protein [Candidatus Poriferisocius sp.]|uniref:amidohydrolase family protein n=1 Tax=Candidatus Poriferisocius sp. TaxID=3101276 RepID=UPI003B5C7566